MKSFLIERRTQIKFMRSFLNKGTNLKMTLKRRAEWCELANTPLKFTLLIRYYLCESNR